MRVSLSIKPKSRRSTPSRTSEVLVIYVFHPSCFKGVAIFLTCLTPIPIHLPLPRYLPEVTHKVFLEIEIDGDEKGSGRITLGLFGTIAPKAVENFRSLCACDKGIGRLTNKPLCYRGSIVHSVIKDFGFQAGDFSHGDGTGGESIFKDRFFEDESMAVQHNRRGLISMANSGKRNTNGSQFFINTASSALWLDGKNIVFGYVLEGMDVIEAMDSKGSYGGRPKKRITIVDSGNLPVKEADRKKVPVPAKSSLSL